MNDATVIVTGDDLAAGHKLVNVHGMAWVKIMFPKLKTPPVTILPPELLRALSQREAEIFLLLQSSKHPLTSPQIGRAIWPDTYTHAQHHSVMSNLHRLRKKLDPLGYRVENLRPGGWGAYRLVKEPS